MIDSAYWPGRRAFIRIVLTAGRVYLPDDPSLTNDSDWPRSPPARFALALFHRRYGAADAAIPTAKSSAAPVIAAVGDIACPAGEPVTATTCRHADVAKAIQKADPDSVWLLGDIQYPRANLG